MRAGILEELRRAVWKGSDAAGAARASTRAGDRAEGLAAEGALPWARVKARASPGTGAAPQAWGQSESGTGSGPGASAAKCATLAATCASQAPSASAAAGRAAALAAAAAARSRATPSAPRARSAARAPISCSSSGETRAQRGFGGRASACDTRPPHGRADAAALRPYTSTPPCPRPCPCPRSARTEGLREARTRCGQGGGPSSTACRCNSRYLTRTSACGRRFVGMWERAHNQQTQRNLTCSSDDMPPVFACVRRRPKASATCTASGGPSGFKQSTS